MCAGQLITHIDVPSLAWTVVVPAWLRAGYYYCNNELHVYNGIIIIIIIIIRKGRQCKAGRERLTPYQSEDPNPTTPTHRMKEEKGKTVGDKK